jgi:hypothetical protein
MATQSPLALAQRALAEAQEQLETQLAAARPHARALHNLLETDHRGWVQPLNKVCFRSDTRPPEVIFRNGFLDRETEATFPKTLDFLSKLSQVERDTRIVSLPVTEVPSFRNALHYFTKESPKTPPPMDVDPANAVALTRRLGFAPLFPLADTDTGAWAKETWIYAVWVERAYLTYERQLAEGSKLADAKEVAVRVVPGKHVIGAVKCVRKGLSKKGETVDYVMKAPIEWNPVHTVAAQRLRASQQFEKYLEKEHKIYFWGDASLTLQPKGTLKSVYKDVTAPEDRVLQKTVFNTFDSIMEALHYNRQPYVDAMQQVRAKEWLVKLHSGLIPDSDSDDESGYLSD